MNIEQIILFVAFIVSVRSIFFGESNDPDRDFAATHGKTEMKKVDVLSDEHASMIDELTNEIVQADRLNHSPVFLAELISNKLLTDYELYQKPKTALNKTEPS